MTGRTTDDAFGRLIRTKPTKNLDGTVRDMSAYTVTLELYPPDRSAPVVKSGTGGSDGRLSYTIADGDWEVGGVPMYGRWGVRFYASASGENLESPLGYVHVSATQDPG